MSDLPEHWAVAPLRDLVSKLVDGSHNPPPKKPHGLPMLSAINIANNDIEMSTFRLIDPDAFALEDQRTRIAPGDVLLTIVGAIGRTAIVPKNVVPFTLQRSVAVLSPILVDSKFLMYQLEAPRLARYLADNARGTAQKGVYLKTLGQMQVWIPPLEEQRRIVGKIEELFSKLDKGVESLTTAREQLKAYRQSILKAAFEGKLTEDWRAQNVDKLEGPEALMGRIKLEREDYFKEAMAEWKDSLSRWSANGENGSKPSKPKSLNDYPPKFHDLRIRLPELPIGWAWSHLGWCSMGPEYGTAAKSSETGAVPVVRMGNLQGGCIDWSDLVYTSDQQEIKQYSLRPGDVLFNRTNSPELVGKTSIYKGEREAVFAGYLVRVNHIERIALGKYLTYFLSSPIAREHGNTVKTDGVNQSNINATKLQEYPFPFCSVAEQAVIVRILDGKLSAADAMESEIETGLARAAALRQSILKRAFSGQLIAQDPADEPATKLLERIRFERENGGTIKQRNSRKNKSETAPSHRRKIVTEVTDA